MVPKPLKRAWLLFDTVWGQITFGEPVTISAKAAEFQDTTVQGAHILMLEAAAPLPGAKQLVRKLQRIELANSKALGPVHHARTLKVLSPNTIFRLGGLKALKR